MSSNVIIVNPIEVPVGREEEALAIWDQFAAYFREQPGYVNTRLHRTLDPNAKFHFVNIAEWKSMEQFIAALHNDEIKAIGEGFPSEMPHYPAPYEVIRTWVVNVQAGPASMV